VSLFSDLLLSVIQVTTDLPCAWCS